MSVCVKLSLDLYYTEDEIYELSLLREPRNPKSQVRWQYVFWSFSFVQKFWVICLDQIITFIKQGCIKWSRSDSKHFYNVTKYY